MNTLRAGDELVIKYCEYLGTSLTVDYFKKIHAISVSVTYSWNDEQGCRQTNVCTMAYVYRLKIWR